MRIIDYIKRNKNFLIVMFIGIVIFSIQTSFVVMYADDMSLGKIANEDGILGAFSHMKKIILLGVEDQLQ